MRLRLCRTRLLLVAALSTLPSGVAGQTAPPPDEPTGVVPVSEPTDSEFDERRTERLEIRLRLEHSVHDNFERLPEDEEEDDTTAQRAQLGLFWSPVAGRPYKLFVEGVETDYDDRPSTRTFAGGFRLDGSRHFVETRGEISEDRPAIDLEDDPDPADVQRFDGEYDVTLGRDWQVSTGVQIEDRTHDAPGKDSRAGVYGAALRWRGFGSLLSPEIGIGAGSKNADRPNDEYTQLDAFARLRSRPIERLYLSLRYRYREREYDVELPRASNFGRIDDRDEWTLRADVTAARFAIVNLEYVWIDSVSSRPDKSFTSSELSVGLTLRHRHPQPDRRRAPRERGAGGGS